MPISISKTHIIIAILLFYFISYRLIKLFVLISTKIADQTVLTWQKSGKTEPHRMLSLHTN
jgi:hypothetical protein